MFVRIRGKGACPENSQAAIMHIRGFRHTHSRAPADSYYTVVTSTPTAADAAGDTNKSTATPTAERVPFHFALFPVGIHAATLTAAQAKFMKPSSSSSSAPASPPSAEAPPAGQSNGGGSAAASAVAALDSEVARMVWKETWNLYDILYDEVPLLPWVESLGDAAAAAVVETVERELRLVAATTTISAAAPASSNSHASPASLPTSASAATSPRLRTLASLADKTDDFVVASTRPGNRQVVVCPHYYAPAALPANSFSGVGTAQGATAPGGGGAVHAVGDVVIFDLAELPLAQAGGKAMVNVAWYTAFVAMQPDSALLHCRAVVVRLPYTTVPSYAQACSQSAAAGAPPTMADAFKEMVDFIGEHIAAVHHGMVLALQSASPESAAAVNTAAPPVIVIGSTPGALSGCLHALLGGSSASAKDSTVVVVYGDHLGAGGDSDAHEAACARQALLVSQYQSIAEACACTAAFEMMLVPLKALLDGGDEPWDEYTLRERARLNFCPCCGDCGGNTESDGADEAGHGHSHGHGHGHGHEHGH